MLLMKVQIKRKYIKNYLFFSSTTHTIYIFLYRWLKGRSLKTRQSGIFPANYTTKGDLDLIQSSKALPSDVDICLDEINQTLHQWGNLLSFFVKSRKFSDFGRLKGCIAPLLECRNNLISTSKTADEKKIAISNASDIIGKVTKDFGLDAIVRHPTKQVASILNTGTFSLLSMVKKK